MRSSRAALPPFVARRAAARGFSSPVSSRAATACTAASISAICAGKRSRNRPEMRQVTSTRARPIAAGGNTSMPVTRPLAGSQIGRQPISANPWAISSPPVRSVALPHRSITIARGASPCVCRCIRTTSSAASRPRSIAVWVGSVRGSAVKRLRPVGNTSRRPRLGAPAGPGATRRPSSAARSASRSASALACQSGSPVPAAAAVNVQAVLDGEVLEIAQPGVDPAQRIVGRGGAADRRPRAPVRSAARSRRSVSPAARAGGDRARRPGHIRRSGARARAHRRKVRRRQAAAADGRSSRRRCGAWPAPLRPDC